MRTRTTTADVDAYEHGEAKRTNIPTAELQAFAPDDGAKTLLYPRNPDLDPQLVWRGKDAEDAEPLAVDAAPIYIQEKIRPEAIVADLQRRSKARREEAAEQVDLFADFDGIDDPEAKTEFYTHDANWANRMILGDSLLVMASLAERENLRGRVQAIYFDPPYGIKFNSNWQPSTRTRDVKDGKLESMSREPEVVRAFRDTWKDGIHSYLSYLRDRLTAARDLLTESGSVFVQIGDENVHLVRSLLDEVFGADNHCAQIIFRKTTGKGSDLLDVTVDFIVWYAKDRSVVKYRPLFEERDPTSEVNLRLVQMPDGQRRTLTRAEFEGSAELPKGARIYRPNPLTSSRVPQGADLRSYLFNGQQFTPGKGTFKTNLVGLSRVQKADRLMAVGRSLSYIRFLDDFRFRPRADVWDDTRTGGFADEKIYVVQTTAKAVERCLLMTTDPGDLVLDPTCGSGTTAYVAEQWGRRWITIDTSRVALALARTRLMAAKFDYYIPRDCEEGAAKESEILGRPVPGPDHGGKPDLRQGFVYERVPRVTLKAIANNTEIDEIHAAYEPRLEEARGMLNTVLDETWEEWQVPRETKPSWPAAACEAHAAFWSLRRERQAEIDASIARNAEVELLYDRPYKARGVVRVSGPFTVESLSPHRVLPLAEDPVLLDALGEGGGDAAADGATQPQTDFATVVLENLKAAGVQNTKKGETLRFEWIKPFASKRGYIAFEAQYSEGGAVKRAAIAIGPEYDTVGFDLVKNAAREAMHAFDTLIVCGFAFAPEVDDSRLHFGELTVLKARMNQDLRMGDKLKAGTGNLFVVFGEPDIAVEHLPDGMVRVEIRGVDIFDPTTGEVRSSQDPAEDIACWFIDDAYDEESFFVRQAYFLGRDPYESLKRALKAEIDEAAWGELHSTVSRPFRPPANGLICVKVINHFGDEVQKVFRVT
ncbi:site-specific DNA-methyltransferase [Salinarimonas chemoclinalis]|uniref:site-specific DNA-methyltransferase n=1 Tax=Salinarimonas chemoclinalis TaxID=3241599 RepID=UPI0035573ADE